jgi:hypothetical protein
MATTLMVTTITTRRRTTARRFLRQDRLALADHHPLIILGFLAVISGYLNAPHRSTGSSTSTSGASVDRCEEGEAARGRRHRVDQRGCRSIGLLGAGRLRHQPVA